MRTELEHVSPVRKEIKVEIEPAEIKPVYDKVIGQYTRLATVPGFRKGYAPTAVVKNRFKEDIQNDVLRELLPERIQQAIQEHELQPLSEPQLHLDDAENIELNGTQPLALHVHVEVMPEIETVNYKGLEAVRRVRPVTDEDLERMIDQRRQDQASFQPVEDRAAEIGDTVVADIRGRFVDDPDADPITVDDLQIELGGAGVERSFTENLVGVSPDEEKTFTVNYPEDFTSPGLAGKSIEYTATVKSVGKIEIPELNDEWAQSLDEGYESAADLREKLRQDMGTMSKIESDNRLRDDLMNRLIDANPIEVPPTLVNYQAQGLTRQFAGQMEERGVDMRQADEKVWQMLFQRMLPQAEREVRGALLLDEIAGIEAVEVSPEEINGEIEAIAGYSGRSTDEVRQALTKENGEAGIAERLRNRKAIEILLDNANVTDGEWQEEAAETEPEQTPPAASTETTAGTSGAAATEDETQTGEAEEKPATA